MEGISTVSYEKEAVWSNFIRTSAGLGDGGDLALAGGPIA